MQGPDRVPRLARPFVAGFLVLMVCAALFVWEPWPFTSFRLFSQLRLDEQTAWVVKAADAGGAEEDLPLEGELRGFEFQIREFAVASSRAPGRALPAVGELGAGDRRPHDGRGAALSAHLAPLRARRRSRPARHSELVYVCDSDGATVAG